MKNYQNFYYYYNLNLIPYSVLISVYGSNGINSSYQRKVPMEMKVYN